MGKINIPNATVFIQELNRSATTDSNGNCLFDVPPGTYHLTVTHGDFETKTVTTVVGNSGKNEEIEMFHGIPAPTDPYVFNGQRTILVQNVNADYDPLPGVTVRLKLDGYYDQTLTTGSDGKCTFTNTPVETSGTNAAMQCHCTKEGYTDVTETVYSYGPGNSAYGSPCVIQMLATSSEPETPAISTNGKAKVYIYEIGTESTWDERYAKPVSGISVNMHIDNPSYNQTKTTNNDGICLFENVPLEHSTDIIENALTIERQNGYRFYSAGSDTVERTVFDAFVGDSDHYNDYNKQIRARAIPRKAYRLTGYVTPENNNSQAITGIKAQLISSDGTYNETIDVGSGMVADIQFDNVPIGTVTLKVNHINKNTDYKSYETTFTVTNDDAAMQTYWQNQGDGKSYTYEEFGIAKLTYPVRLQLEEVAPAMVDYTVNVKDAETNANIANVPVVITCGSGNSPDFRWYSGTTNSSGTCVISVEANREYECYINQILGSASMSFAMDYVCDYKQITVGSTNGSYNSKIYHCKLKIWLAGATLVSETNRTVVESGYGVAGATVKIYDENETTLLDTVTSNSEGYAIFKVTAGVTYKVVPSKTGYVVQIGSHGNKFSWSTYGGRGHTGTWATGIISEGNFDGIIGMETYQNNSSSGSTTPETPETPEYVTTGFFRGKCTDMSISTANPASLMSGVTVQLTIPATGITYTQTSNSQGIVEFRNIKIPYSANGSDYQWGHLFATKSGYRHDFRGDGDSVDSSGNPYGWQSVTIDYTEPSGTFSIQIEMRPV